MLQAIIDCLAEGVCIIDLATYKIEYINNAAREIIGIGKDDRVGYCFDYFGNGDAPCSGCNSQVLNRLKGFKAEEHYNSRDGKIYKLNTELIQQGDKKYRAVFFVEESSIKSEGFVNKNKTIRISALDAMQMPYWEYDLQTHRCIPSAEAQRIFGWGHTYEMHPEEIRDEYFVSRAESDKLRNIYRQVLEGADHAEDVCQIDINGNRKWVNIMLAVAKDENGNRTHAVGIVKDIDPQKRLIDAFNMAMMQNEFRFMSYSLGNGEFIIYDGMTNRTFVPNFGDEHVLGLEKFHPEDRAKVIDVIENAKAGVKEQECIMRRRHNDNEIYKTFKMKITTAFDSSGKPDRLYISRKDITEEIKNRKLYESQLNYLENYRKKSLCYAQVDLDKNKVVDVKSRYSRFRKDIEGNTLENFASMVGKYVPEDSRDELVTTLDIVRIFKDYEAGISKFEVSVPIYLSDDRLIFANFAMDVLKNPATNAMEGYIIVHDDTEESLILQIGKTITAMDYDAMGVLDINSGMVKTIYNQPGGSETFIAKEELDYKDNIEHFMKILPVKHRELIRRRVSIDNVIKKVKEKGKYVETVTAMPKPGVIKHIQLSYTQINRFPNRFLMGIKDVSAIYDEEVKKRELLKKALAKAKAGENAKIDFLSRMSHDLRTPLNGILGMAQIALDESNEAEIQEYQRKIISSGQMLLSLVNDILDISQAEEKKFVLHPEPYSMSEFLESINTIIGEQCRSKGVEYSVEFDSIADKVFNIDRLRFGQIFLNLLSNSCKYTPEGGKVLYKADMVRESNGMVMVEFHVIDSGIGMSREFLEHAFDAFSQAHTSTIDTRQGSGLGLSIVKQLVDLLKGKIIITSEKGRGTDVKVVLELEECEVTEKEKGPYSKESKGDLTGKKALVVEDQPLNAKILVKILTQKGMYVDLAEDGNKAVNAYLESKEGNYDIVLMDIRMPVMDGIEATKIIRSHKERSDWNLPIIATTANAFVEDREACIKAGMNDHVAKPINVKELYKILAENIN